MLSLEKVFSRSMELIICTIQLENLAIRHDVDIVCNE